MKNYKAVPNMERFMESIYEISDGDDDYIEIMEALRNVFQDMHYILTFLNDKLISVHIIAECIIDMGSFAFEMITVMLMSQYGFPDSIDCFDDGHTFMISYYNEGIIASFQLEYPTGACIVMVNLAMLLIFSIIGKIIK